MAQFVKLQVPEAVKEKQLQVLDKVRKTGKIKIGVNEVTKAVERNSAKLVVMAEDVSPPELLMHIPVLCKEKGIPFTYVNTKKELGEKAGIKVGTSAIALTDEGEAKKELVDLVKKLSELSK
ncbi:MAG TPA: 50S ribosomal protein L7Ae [archaeon]|nr:50S ribosomal protein L7Ae [archaeon]